MSNKQSTANPCCDLRMKIPHLHCPPGSSKWTSVPLFYRKNAIFFSTISRLCSIFVERPWAMQHHYRPFHQTQLFATAAACTRSQPPRTTQHTHIPTQPSSASTLKYHSFAKSRDTKIPINGHSWQPGTRKKITQTLQSKFCLTFPQHSHTNNQASPSNSSWSWSC